MLGRLLQIGCGTGKKRKEEKINFWEIYIVFDNDMNYNSYSDDAVRTIQNILNKDLEVEYISEKKLVKISLKNPNPIFSKRKEQAEVIVKRWRNKIHKNIIGKFDVETVLIYNSGIIKVFLS